MNIQKINELLENNGLLVKYNKFWDKSSNSIQEGFDSEPVHNLKCVKLK